MELFFGSGNTVALVATHCPHCPQYEVTLIYSSTNNSDSRRRDNNDECHDDNSFQPWLQTVSQEANRLDPGFRCPSQIQTEKLQRLGHDTAGLLEQHELWTLVQQLRSLIPTCASVMVCPWQKHPALVWGLQVLETFSTPPISAANCAQC